MPKFQGTIRKSDLEGGHWQLESEDGETYVLESATAATQASMTDGQRVEIEGTIERNALSFAMTGPTLKVRSIKNG